MQEIAVEVRVRAISTYARPFRGQAFVRLTERGLDWQSRRRFGGQRDGALWEQIHTFGREGALVNIAWEHDSDTQAAIEFVCSFQTAQEMEKAARALLDEAAWQSPHESSEHGHWDALWWRGWSQKTREQNQVSEREQATMHGQKLGIMWFGTWRLRSPSDADEGYVFLPEGVAPFETVASYFLGDDPVARVGLSIEENVSGSFSLEIWDQDNRTRLRSVHEPTSDRILRIDNFRYRFIEWTLSLPNDLDLPADIEERWIELRLEHEGDWVAADDLIVRQASRET